MRTWLSLAAAAAFLVSGCDQSFEGGTPKSSSSFTIKGPPLGPTIKQNEKETVKLSLDRKSEFKKDVKLSVEAPEKIKAELSRTMVKASEETDFTVAIAVHQDAAIGDHIVKVTATPEGGGAATTLDVKVKVEKP